MIPRLTQITQLLHTAAKEKHFNASLPLTIKVLAKLKGDLYLLQIGSQKIETKSHKELLIGGRYWGEMGKSSLGHIALRNLVMQPQILQSFQHSPLHFSIDDLKSLFSLEEQTEESNIFEDFKDFILQKLANASSKNEFLFLSNMLLALKSGVLNLIVGEKENILQVKKIATNKVRFTAIMPILGMIEGEITHQNQDNILDIKVLYESTKEILEKNLEDIRGFKVGVIRLDQNIKPMYEFKEQLLDIKG